MSNTIVDNLVPRILPTTLEVLYEQTPLLNWAAKDYAYSAAEKGNTVTIQKSVPLSSGTLTPAMVAPSPQDIAPGYTTISIDQWVKASFGLTKKEITEIMEKNWIPFQLQEAVRSVSNAVAANIWSKYFGISNVAGTAATGMFASNSIAAAASASYALDKALCPRGNRRMWVSLRDAFDARSNTAYGQYYNVGKEPSGDNIVRDGALKALYDFKSVEQDYFTPVHTIGTLGGGTLALAANADANATTVSVTVTGGAGMALKAGDCITIGTETGNARTGYSIVADASIAAAGTGNLLLNRGLTTAKSSGAAVALLASWGTGINNIAGDPTGIGIVMRYPSADMMGNRTMYESAPLIDPRNGAVLCLTYLGGYHQASWEISALFGTAFVDERKLCRVLSYAALTA